jgi:hypothetical protein
MTPLTEQQVFEYEAGKVGIIQSFIINWFPKYFFWRTKLRYKRYLGFMEYKKIKRDERLKFFQHTSEIK